jgi:hypothetical protein
MLVGGTVQAQPAEQTATPPPDGTQQADIGVKQQATIDPQEMLKQSQQYREQVVGAIGKLEAKLEEAKKAKDVILANAVMDSLMQAKANLAVMDQAIVQLQDAAARGDKEAALHNYARVTIVRQKVETLVAEAEAAAGQDLAFVGATRVGVDIDPGVRADDPSVANVFEPGAVSRPVPPGANSSGAGDPGGQSGGGGTGAEPPLERPPVLSPYK